MKDEYLPGIPVPVQLTNDEITAAVSLLEFAVMTFQMMAVNAEKMKDFENLDRINLQIAFAKLLADKLANSFDISGDETIH